MDKRVIDIPFIGRWMLVNLIIAPFRAPKSAKVYRQLWQDRGSPLLFYGEDVVKILSSRMEEFEVVLAMRYQSPSIEKGLQYLKEKNVAKIIVVPVFPQYASATTGSVHDKVMEIVSHWQIIPEISFISKFFDHPLFIKAFVERGKQYLDQEHYDKVVFSYHGLPERQIRKASVQNYCKLDQCCNSYHSLNQYCYRAQCFATSRLIAEGLGLSQDQYTVCFQSRLGREPWLQPYAEDVIEELASKNLKVLAFSPSFVADCLETTVEGGEEFRELFEEKGGDKWQLVESLNDHPLWIDCLEDMIKNKV